MRKNLFLVALVGTAIQINAQTTVFNETFDSITSLPAGWEVQNINGNGSWWTLDDEPSITDPLGFSGKVVVSFEDSPNDVIGTTSINLPAGSLSLTYQIGTYTQGGALPYDSHYAVYVLPATAIYSVAETPIFEETIATGDVAMTKTINLSSYAGQNVRIYFRVFDTGTKALILDNIKVTQATLGTSEVSENAKVGISPNPATDFITVKSKSKINSIEVFDVVGRKMTTTFNDDKIDVRNLQSGSYILKIETKDGIKTEKFIKK